VSSSWEKVNFLLSKLSSILLICHSHFSLLSLTAQYLVLVDFTIFGSCCLHCIWSLFKMNDGSNCPQVVISNYITEYFALYEKMKEINIYL
jgi:hypothetical protein